MSPYNLGMDISIPENAGVLAYLTSRHPEKLLAAPAESAANPYYRLGSHPEIVEQLWNVLNSALPVDCRLIVCGTPALVQPATGVILALAMDTQYALCLPGGLAAEAGRRGARTETRWAGGSKTDVRQVFGEAWVFGRFLREESDWLGQSYAFFLKNTHRQETV
jgi:hypothetical protein